MEDLVKLEIVFENCDSITIDRKHIYNFFISGIKERIALVANALLQYKYAESCHLTLRWDEVKNFIVSLEDRTLESRIKTKDITHYYLHLTNGTVIQIHVPWDGPSEYTNAQEDHKIVAQGDKELFVITH